MSTSQGCSAANASLSVTYRTILGCDEDARTLLRNVLRSGRNSVEWVIAFGTFYNVSFFSLFSLTDSVLVLTKSRDGVFHSLLKQTSLFLKRSSFCLYNPRPIDTKMGHQTEMG